jgi:beta-1,2-mannobiose phosphorylase / 1,2-beta-oligomannan phosphorylase
VLDANDPTRVLKRAAEPFMVPEADFEVTGFVPNVVFPTGVVPDGENLLVYYGAADAVTAVAEFSLSEVLTAVSARD